MEPATWRDRRNNRARQRARRDRDDALRRDPPEGLVQRDQAASGSTGRRTLRGPTGDDRPYVRHETSPRPTRLHRRPPKNERRCEPRGRGVTRQHDEWRSNERGKG